MSVVWTLTGVKEPTQKICKLISVFQRAVLGLARQAGTGGFMQNQARFLQTFCDFYVQICVLSDIYGLKILRTEGVSKHIDALKLSHENVKVVHYNKRQ